MAPEAVPARSARVIAPNLKPRQTGVSSTIFRLVPLQRRLGCAIASVGWLPPDHPRLSVIDLVVTLLASDRRTRRVWHARRNVEMLSGILLRALGANLALLFTSAAQRRHTAYTRWLIGRMDRIVATSARSGSYLDVPHAVLSHGVDTAMFSPPVDRREAKRDAGLEPDALHLVSFGVSMAKGTDVLVEALLSVLPEHPRWRCLLVGGNRARNREFMDTLERRVAESGLADRIGFTGYVDDARPFIAAAELCVAPSRKEGFGLTPLEAMASAIPVVASDAGSYREIVVDGTTGRVVPAGDHQALAAALAALMGSDDLRRRMGEAGRRHVVENYALEGEARGLIAVYDELLATG